MGVWHLTCAECGDAFTEPSRRGAKPRYCSGACREAGTAAYERERYLKRRARYDERAHGGVCTRCGKAPATLGRMCWSCRVQTRREQSPDAYHAGVPAQHRTGLPPALYAELLREQGGRCAACRRLPDTFELQAEHDRSHCVTHNACRDCVRGLVCEPCHRAILLLDADPDRTEGVADYLRGRAAGVRRAG